MNIRAHRMALAGLAVLGLAVAGCGHQDPTVDRPPPPGPNARPDAPNPDKLKHLPGALSPAGSGSQGSAK